MARTSIPIPVIAVAAQILETYFTHTEIDTLMESLGIPGLPPQGNKVQKLRGWLKNANQDPNPHSDALEKFGKVLEEFMEVNSQNMSTTLIEDRKRMHAKLREYGLEYAKGGHIISTTVEAPAEDVFRYASPQSPTPTLGDIVKWKQVTDAQKELESNPMPKKEKHTIFLGHGHSPVWRELKDFIVGRLHQDYEEFNREATAGYSTKERLEEMLKNADFAFLVMTAEDERGDGQLHARDNVIHEAGLFQGKLGFQRAIILKEEACQEFSNIHGLTHISFPRNRISAAFEEVRRVLEREGIIKN